MSHLPCRDT